MIRSDEENLSLAISPESVDELNARFYGKYSFPWRPVKFDSLVDPDFETMMLNQALGDWKHKRVAANSEIWVAGCGTNQAAFTALRFPKANVTGSDVSAESLQACGQSAKDIGISNLELRRESINQSQYRNRFDYVICTGVIHHNADPEAALTKLADALKPNGVMELMVYNRYHRIVTSVFQKAVRMLTGNTSAPDFEAELEMAKHLITDYPVRNLISSLFTDWDTIPEAALADRLIQPVEYSYTVESLDAMASRCGLEIVLPCMNSYNKLLKEYSWNLHFKDSHLQKSYDSLPDVRRWQVTNLLLFEKSPMLWFYLQKKGSSQRKSEKEVCDEFLDTTFVKTTTQQRAYVLQDDGRYKTSDRLNNFPQASPDASVKEIFEAADGKTVMRDLLERHGFDMTFSNVNAARIKLTTPAFPFLKAIDRRADLPADDEQWRLKAEELQRFQAQRFNRLNRRSASK